MNRRARSIAIALVMAAGPPCARAQTTSGADDSASPRAEAIAVVYDGSGFLDSAGGARRGAVYFGTLNVALSIDGDRLFHARGLTGYGDVVWIHGGPPDAFAGDAQGVSNLTGPSSVRVEEAWLQLNVLANRLSVLAGRYDLNTEFYRTQSAGLFLNSSLGVGPEFSQSGQAGPSLFPSTSIGARVAFKPTPDIVLRTAVFDGVPVDRPGGEVAVFKRGDGLLFLSEATFLRRPTSVEQEPRKIRFRIGRASGLPPYDAKATVGGWYYTATFPDLSVRTANGAPVPHSGSGGAYVVADTVITRVHGDDHRRVTAFVEGGVGDQRVNRFRGHLVAGLVATGIVHSRAADQIGIAVAWARNGSHFIQMEDQSGVPTGRAETAIEVAWLSPLASRLALQPDFQYIVHPGTFQSTSNACAFQLRFEVKM